MISTLKAALAAATLMVFAGQPPARAGEAIDPAVPDILPMRARAHVRDAWLEDRLATIIPALLRREGIDMWVLIAREYNEDPVVRTMLPATWLSARRRTILWQFLVESMAVSALGVVVGFVMASVVAVLVQKYTPLAARVPPTWIALGVGVVVIVGLIFGLWPAIKAARLDPIEALRYE